MAKTSDSLLIETGRIVNTHGIDGKISVQPWADSPQMLTAITSFYIDTVPYKVLSAGVHKNNIIMKLEGVDSIESAIALKGKTISALRSDFELEDGKYFISDLVGLQAVDAQTGETLGVVADVLTLPAHNVYVVKNDKDCNENNTAGKELLIPAVDEFIEETNPAGGYIKFRLIEGL